MHLAATMNRFWPSWLTGLFVAVLIALAATFVAEHYGGPQLLYALFFGMALNFLAHDGRTKPGIQFAARHVLRLGVALLGARIAMDQIVAIGFLPMLWVAIGVIVTIATGLLLSRVLGTSTSDGLLTGGAVAICGASAALAIASVLPKSEHLQRYTIITVVGVTALSTIAMVLYPLFAGLLGMSGNVAGLFIGATIHDVAQVVGAGYLMSTETGDTAIVVKLFRVALLVPVVLSLSILFRGKATPGETKRPPLVPAFLIAFCLLVLVNSVGVLPAPLVQTVGEFSRWCLVVAIAALGMQTSLQDLASLGWAPIALLVGETVVLAVFTLAYMQGIT